MSRQFRSISLLPVSQLGKINRKRIAENFIVTSRYSRCRIYYIALIIVPTKIICYFCRGALINHADNIQITRLLTKKTERRTCTTTVKSAGVYIFLTDCKLAQKNNATWKATRYRKNGKGERTVHRPSSRIFSHYPAGSKSTPTLPPIQLTGIIQQKASKDRDREGVRRGGEKKFETAPELFY